jgi:uncharacterized protein
LRKSDPNNSLVFDALYGKRTADPKKKLTEEKFLFGLALKAADLSVETAKAMGLFYIDKTVSRGKTYMYRIRIAAGTKPYNATTALADEKQSQLHAPEKLTALFTDKKAMLNFSVVSTRAQYAGYIVERSNDSVHFERINKTLLVFVSSSYEQNKTELFYRDSLPKNNQKYWYRIRGYSYFGFAGPASNIVVGKGKDSWNATPFIDSIYSPDNKTAILKWHIADSLQARLFTYVVMRATKVNGPYLPIAIGALNRFWDPRIEFTNYYLVGAVSSEGDTAFSWPHLLQLSDNEPPPVPQKISGTVDTNGVVHLQWETVAVTDLKGYRVFRCNELREEFFEITDSIISANSYTDTITLQTLTRTVFYSVRSVDRMYNNSAYSAACRLLRPDKIAPVAPVVKKINSNDSCIYLSWINSSSDDVAFVELRRKDDNRLLLRMKSKDTISRYTDTALVRGNSYSYSLTVVDSSGNKSVTSFPTIQFLPRTMPELKGVRATVDREKQQIQINWIIVGSSVDRYVIYKAKKGETMRTWKTVDANTALVIDKEISPGNTYEYWVKAIYKSGAETKPVKLELVY